MQARTMLLELQTRVQLLELFGVTPQREAKTRLRVPRRPARLRTRCLAALASC